MSRRERMVMVDPRGAGMVLMRFVVRGHLLNCHLVCRSQCHGPQCRVTAVILDYQAARSGFRTHVAVARGTGANYSLFRGARERVAGFSVFNRALREAPVCAGCR